MVRIENSCRSTRYFQGIQKEEWTWFVFFSILWHRHTKYRDLWDSIAQMKTMAWHIPFPQHQQYSKIQFWKEKMFNGFWKTNINSSIVGNIQVQQQQQREQSISRCSIKNKNKKNSKYFTWNSAVQIQVFATRQIASNIFSIIIKKKIFNSDYWNQWNFFYWWSHNKHFS